MNVFNDLFTTSKIEFPEQQQLVDSWISSLEVFKKQIKYLGTFLSDVITSFDQYGKQITKTGRSLMINLGKLSNQNSKNLSECIKNCANFTEMLGGVYSRSATTLNNSISQKLNKATETLNEIKKGIAEESTNSMKNLSQAKIAHLKSKVKYEKAKKEHEIILANTKKVKNDPSNMYQPAVIQRAKEKTKASKKEVASLLKVLNEHVENIHQKNDVLENSLYDLHLNALTFEKDSASLLHEILKMIVIMLKNIVALRKEQALLKNEQLGGLANITLDMVGGKESENNSNTLEYLSFKLDTRVNSCEDRLKVLKCFRAFISELIQCEENFTKALEKSIKSLILPEYLDYKPLFKSAWENFIKTISEICKIHIEQAKEMNKKANDPVIALVNSQSNLSKNLQIIVQKIMKDHALTHEECLKEFERLKRGGEDASFQKKTSEIREKMLQSNQNTEHLVLSSLADNSNQEAGNLQILKVSLIHIYTMEDTLNTLLSLITDSSFDFLTNINIAEDFENLQIYSKKSLPSVLSFGEVSHTSESVEPEEDTERLNEDNIMQKFGLKGKVTVIETFSCALSQKLLLQGRLYLTTTHICFHSYFNSSTIFGRETVISIPLSEITEIERKTSALIFDNAIAITTNTSNFVFKSFLYREQAFATLENLLKMTQPALQTQHICCEFLVETKQHRLDIQKLMKNVKSNTFVGMASDEILKHEIITEEFLLDISPQQFFFHFFSDESADFLEKYLKIIENTEVFVSKWAPEVPSFYLDPENDEKWEKECTRNIKYTHPVKERVPMMPKTCLCNEIHTVYFLSKHEFIVDNMIKVSGVPLSDCFVAYMRFKVKGEKNCKVEVIYGVEFVKSTMFRKKIENTGIAESKNSINNIWIPLVKNKIQVIKGETPVESVRLEKIEEKKEENGKKTEIFVGAVLVLIILYLWISIRHLQSQIDMINTELKGSKCN